MERHTDNIQDLQGNAVTGVTVTVRRSVDSSLASIFSDDIGTVRANPFTNDVDGEFFFYGANDEYDIVLSGPVSETREAVKLFDQDDTLLRGSVLVGTAAGPSLVSAGSVVLVDVSSNAVALTLPLDQGATFQQKDITVQHIAGEIRANNITVGRNSELVGGEATDWILNQPNQRCVFRWAGSTLGWTLFSSSPTPETDVLTSALTLPDATLIACLSVPVVADGLYELEATLLVTSSAADDFQFDFTTPAADSIDGLVLIAGIVPAQFVESAAEVVLTSGSLEVIKLHAIVDMAATAGTLTLRAAKNADTGADGSVGIGSMMKLRRLA